MANRYHSKEVLEAFYAKASEVCRNVFTRTRPTAVEKMDTFIVIRFSVEPNPTSSIHNGAMIVLDCFARDRQGGISNENALDELVSGVCAMAPFDDGWLRCNGTPMPIATRSDGMGFHHTEILFTKLIIEV